MPDTPAEELRAFRADNHVIFGEFFRAVADWLGLPGEHR